MHGKRIDVVAEAVLIVGTMAAAEEVEVPRKAWIGSILRTRPVVVRLQICKGTGIGQTIGVAASWISESVIRSLIPQIRIIQVPHLAARYVVAGCSCSVITQNIWAIHC